MRLEKDILCEGILPYQLALMARAGDLAVAEEGLTGAYQVGFIAEDNEGIREINLAQRDINAPTDVLSFPSVAYPSATAKAHEKRLRQEIDVDTGCIHLGDIIISYPRACEQAEQYGHSITRELTFLFVHGVLHLLGYDHETDTQREAMRAMEETIMSKVGISRELTDADFALIEGAKEAMQRAYAPYSKYKVGACLRTTDGKLHKGCNVENASYGMTICAERNALTTAVTEGMTGVEAIAIAGEGSMPYPCGACRQFIREFAKNARVLLVCDGDTIEVTDLESLLPNSFGPESLKEVD